MHGNMVSLLTPTGTYLSPVLDFALRNDPKKPFVVGVLIRINGTKQWIGADTTDWTEKPVRIRYEMPWSKLPSGVFSLKRKLLWRIGLDLQRQRPVRIVNYELTTESSRLILSRVIFGWRGWLVYLIPSRMRRKSACSLPWEQYQPFLESDCSSAFEKMDWFYPADIADMVRALPFAHQVQLMNGLKPTLAANTIKELEAHYQYPILDKLPSARTTELLSLLPSHHASAILREYKDPEKLVRLIPQPLQDKIKLQLGYDPGTAGAWMDMDFFTFSSKSTCKACLTYLRIHPLPPESVFYIYIENEQHEFIGVVSIRSVIMSPPEMLLEALMKTNLIVLTVQTPKDTVANIMSRYHLLALPVVDENKKIAGVIKIYDVLASTLEYPV